MTAQRRKLKKFKKKVESNQMTFEMVRTAYNSWKGYAKKKNAFKTIQCMDRLFDDLLINKGVSHD